MGKTATPPIYAVKKGRYYIGFYNSDIILFNKRWLKKYKQYIGYQYKFTKEEAQKLAEEYGGRVKKL